MTISIHKIQIEESDGKLRLVAYIKNKILPSKLWFEVPRDHANYIDQKNTNWAMVALLYPAMLLGEDIEVDGSVCNELHFNINHDLQSFLQIFDQRLRKIKIIAHSTPGTPIDDQSAKLVGTGFSAGVDSFSTIQRYLKAECITNNLRISAITLFNVGSFGKGEESQLLYAKSIAICKEYASQNNIHFISSSSNLPDFYRQPGLKKSNFEKTNTLRNVAASLVFEGALSRYYISSSFPPSRIAAKPSYNVSYLDPIILPLLSSNNLKIISSCAGLGRIEKTNLIAKSPEAQKYLNVCAGDIKKRLNSKYQNCSECTKCIRTMMTLEAGNNLENFSNVFDLEKFKNNKLKLYSKIVLSALKGNPLDQEVIKLILQRR